MKYIRTKDEIIKIENEWEYASCGGITVYNENENLYIADDDIIKTADNLEELFDEAVFFDNDNKPHYQSQEGSIWWLGAALYIKTLRFGIFTDKGFIYKAKMNDKEEKLELL